VTFHSDLLFLKPPWAKVWGGFIFKVFSRKAESILKMRFCLVKDESVPACFMAVSSWSYAMFFNPDGADPVRVMARPHCLKGRIMEQSVLNEKLTLVSFKFAQFCGYRHATRELIAQMGGNLPSCKAITEGSIKVFPPTGVKEFNTLRRSLVRFLQGLGVQALGSSTCFAIPTTELHQVEAKVADLERKFQKAKDALDSNYENLFESHINNNKEAETIIRSLKVERSEAISKCHFGFNVFRVQAVARQNETEEQSVESMVRGLARRLYEEVATEMTKLHVSDSFTRLRVGQKSLAPIRACIIKMERMSFLDDSIPHAVRLGQEVLAMMPQAGYIERQPFEVLSRCVEIMTDPDKLLNAAHRVRNGVPTLDALFPPVVSAVSAVKPPPARPMAPKAIARPVSPRPAFPPVLPRVPRAGLPGIGGGLPFQIRRTA
jgi:hypothetical protein